MVSATYTGRKIAMKKIALLLLAAMLLSPHTSYAAGPITIKEGTEVLLKVINKLKSGNVQKGQVATF